MRRVGFDQDAIEAALRRTNDSACSPALPDHEVQAIARSVSHYRPEPLESRRSPPSDVPSSIPWLDLASFAKHGVPEVRWTAEQWIARRDIVLVAGAGGIGKSTTLAAWALALARGEDFCDIKTAGPTRVLYLDEEMGQDETVRLFLRLGGPHDNLRVASCAGLRLDSADVIRLLEHEIASFGAEVVFGDSVQQLFGRSDENSSQEIGAVYKSLFGLRDRLDVAFVLAHHKKKDGAHRSEKIELVRGSTAHSTQPSCVVFATPGEGSRLNLEQVKRRGGTKRSVAIRYEEVGDRIALIGEGPVDPEGGQFEAARELILDYLQEHGTARTGEIQAVAQESRVARRSVERALEQLVESEEIQRPKRGLYQAAEAKTGEVFE